MRRLAEGSQIAISELLERVRRAPTNDFQARDSGAQEVNVVGRGDADVDLLEQGETGYSDNAELDAADANSHAPTRPEVEVDDPGSSPTFEGASRSIGKTIRTHCTNRSYLYHYSERFLRNWTDSVAVGDLAIQLYALSLSLSLSHRSF